MQAFTPNMPFGLRSVIFIVIATAAFTGAWAASANAVSLRVKLACSNDYYAFCSQFSSESPEVRSCMRAAGERLSARCLNALVADGEVSETEVARRAAELGR